MQAWFIWGGGGECQRIDTWERAELGTLRSQRNRLDTMKPEGVHGVGQREKQGHAHSGTTGSRGGQLRAGGHLGAGQGKGWGTEGEAGTGMAGPRDTCMG